VFVMANINWYPLIVLVYNFTIDAGFYWIRQGLTHLPIHIVLP
jgi:hypothetical protein